MQSQGGGVFLALHEGKWWLAKAFDNGPSGFIVFSVEIIGGSREPHGFLENVSKLEIASFVADRSHEHAYMDVCAFLGSGNNAYA